MPNVVQFVAIRNAPRLMSRWCETVSGLLQGHMDYRDPPWTVTNVTFWRAPIQSKKPIHATMKQVFCSPSWKQTSRTAGTQSLDKEQKRMFQAYCGL